MVGIKSEEQPTYLDENHTLWTSLGILECDSGEATVEIPVNIHSPLKSCANCGALFPEE